MDTIGVGVIAIKRIEAQLRFLSVGNRVTVGIGQDGRRLVNVDFLEVVDAVLVGVLMCGATGEWGCLQVVVRKILVGVRGPGSGSPARRGRTPVYS